MWPFKRGPLLDADTMAWHLDAFGWLVSSFADHRAFSASRLVLPAPGFFTHDGEAGHALAERLFRQVESYCALPGPPLALVPEAFIPDDADAPSLGRVQHGPHAMATYAPREGVVRYLPALLREPLVLIGTLAHELGHHLLALPTAEPPPVDGDEIECLTDLAAVYLGFGVFLANQAFSFAQDGGTMSQGWRMARRGYLPEPDLAFATALFVAVRDIDPEPAARRLKPHLAAQMRRALRDLDRHAGRLAAIRASAA